ncbi:tbp-1 interacting protein [Anaeramoeba flamelloides]|uniref:Homologous-pairing protein 2 homolog n=1 Tax=Anaeramoeba flamelloides TaxID=1746091 RepID=A0ABQ8XBQ8_9EUKA|nr:tbp-1 interacting protein [Anaeramoeba flamelloides]
MSRKRNKDDSSSSGSSLEISISSDSSSLSDSLDDYKTQIKNRMHTSSDSDFVDKQPKKKLRNTTKKNTKEQVSETEKPKTTINQKPKPKPKPKQKPKTKPKTSANSQKKSQVIKKYTLQEGKPLMKDLFKTKNRPFSVTNIVDNLESKITTTTVKKVIEELLKEGYITEQSWKKAKIWYVNQSKMEIPDEGAIGKMDDQIKTMKVKHQKLIIENQTFSKEYNRMNVMKTLSLIKKQIGETKDAINSKTSKLEKLKESTNITPLESKKLKIEYDLYRKTWKCRKKIIHDIFSQISEGSGKSLKQLLEDAEIETDEEVGKLFDNTDVDSIKIQRNKKLDPENNKFTN